MKQIMTVFAFTFRDGARKKAFIISTVVMLVVILGLCVAARLMGASGDGAEAPAPGVVSEGIPEDTQFDADAEAGCFYLDADNLVPDGLDALQNRFGRAFRRVEPGEEADVRARIREDGSLTLVIVSGAADSPRATVVTKDFMSGLSNSDVADALTGAYVTKKLSDMGLDGDAVAVARFEMPCGSEIEGSMNLSGYAVGLALTMLMFFCVYYYGYGVAMSVATEKTSRVMETLVVSARPGRILVGKCLAMGVLGLCQVALILTFSAGAYSLIVPGDLVLFGMPLSLSAFTPTSAALVLLYFLLGYALYAMMNAVCGASVSKIEDVNSAMMPVMMLSLIAFYVAYFSVAAGSMQSPLIDAIGLYVPFCSPFKVPFLLLNGGIEPVKAAISLGILLVSVVLVSALSMRVYAASVLRYGKRLKLKDMIKMSRA